MMATNLAFVLMILAALVAYGHSLTSLGWLLGCLALLSIGELLVGALGPSLVLRLAPPQSGGRWIGAWYVTTAVGFWLAGQLGGLWDRVQHDWYFLGMAVAPLIGLILIIGIARFWQLRRCSGTSAS